MGRRLRQAPTVSRASSVAVAMGPGSSSDVTSVSSAEPGGTSVVEAVGVSGPGETTVVDCRQNAGTDERLKKICIGEPSSAGAGAWATADACKKPMGATVVRDLQGKPWGFEDDASCAYR